MLNTFLSCIRQACLSLIAPPYCAYCRSFLTSDTIFCVPCSDRITPIVSAQLHISKDVVVSVYAIAAYKDPIKRLILAKGWRDILASRRLGSLIWEHTYVSSFDFDCIVPIPLHWTRYLSRGYNQAEEIAAVLSAKSNKPVISCLQRIQKTKYQAALSAEQRKKNVHNVFSVSLKKEAIIQGSHILLVDDLMTTGATLQEAAKALLRFKPKKISIVVAARVV